LTLALTRTRDFGEIRRRFGEYWPRTVPVIAPGGHDNQVPIARSAEGSMGQARNGTTVQIFFGALAALTGLPALALAVLSVQRFRTEPDQSWGLLAGGILLGVVAAVFGFAAYLAAADRRKRQTIAARRALHPNEPWLWAEEWRDGRVQSVRGRSAAAVLIIFAVFWNGVVIAVAAAFGRSGELLSTPFIWIFLLVFALAGLFLIGLAVYQTLKARKYDPAVFQMGRMPGVIGGILSGTIQLPPQVPAGVEVGVELTCERTSGSGKSRTCRCLWQDAARLRATSGYLPVAFTIPYGLPPSDKPDEQGTAGIHWWLKAKASLPGVDYSDIFDVPVFITEASDRTIEAGAVDVSHPVSRPSNAKSSIIESGVSRTVIALPPAKGLGCAVTAFVLCPLLAWTISRFAELEVETTVVLYGVALLLIFGTVALVCAGILLTAARLEIDRDALRVPHGRGALKWTRTVPLPNIAKFLYVTSGNPPTQRIDVQTKDGRSYTIAGDLSGIEEAKWLTAELTRAAERCRAIPR
jgi:hypothetical protein